MKILLILRVYSHFEEMIRENDWRPKGMPAVYKLIEGLNEQRIYSEIVFLCRNPVNGINEIFHDKFSCFKYITYTVLPYNKSFFENITNLSIKHFQYIIRLLNKNNYNIIYCDRAHLVYGGIFAFLGHKVFLRLHGVIRLPFTVKPFKKYFIPSLPYWILKKAPFKFVLISFDGSPTIMFKKIFLNNRVPHEIMFNGVDKKRIKTSYNMFRESEYKKKSSKLVITSIGRLTWDKRIMEIIKAVAKLIKINKNFILYIIGDGPLKNNVASIIKHENLENNVFLIGSIKHEEIYKYLSKTDVLLSINEFGNFSNVVIEAMSSGKCIISLEPKEEAQMDGDLISAELHNSLILISRKNIIEKLTIALQKIMENPNIITDKGINAEKMSKKYFQSWEKRINKEIYFIKKYST